MEALKKHWRGGVLLALGALAAASCLDDLPAERTTPRGRPPVVSSDDGGRGGAPVAGARSVARPGGVGVPGGLGMRGDTPTAVRPTPGVLKGSTAGKPPWKGGPRAKVVIEEFTDFECPFCRRGWRVMNRVVRYYSGRVRLVFRHMPITKIHPQAMQAAEAAVCAQRQGKFWAMQDQLFSHNTQLSRADLIKYARRIGLDVPRFTKALDSGACKAPVLRDLALARQRGVTGTPVFFINGTKVEGAYPFRHFKRIIDAELTD